MPASHVLAPHDDGTWRLPSCSTRIQPPGGLAVHCHLLHVAEDAVPQGRPAEQLRR
jgi:hypothetical protein